MSTQQSSYSSSTQGGVSDLFTSDPAWNRQVQLWEMQYGAAKTREIVAQHRASQQQSSQSMSVTAGVTEQIVSAITADRKQINIKVRGSQVVAYSLGYSEFNVLEQRWENLVPVASIQETRMRNDLDSRLRAEFTHTAEIGNTRIYFNLGQSQQYTSMNSNPVERVISAITANRQQINIKVRGNQVIAYNQGGYSSSNVLEQRWENLVPVASIQRTSERNDLDSRLRAEFTHTAEIGNTRIYFNL